MRIVSASLLAVLYLGNHNHGFNAFTPPLKTSSSLLWTSDELFRESHALPSLRRQMISRMYASSEAILAKASLIVEQLADDEPCEINFETGGALDELFVGEGRMASAKSKLKSIVGRTLGLVRSSGSSAEIDDEGAENDDKRS